MTSHYILLYSWVEAKNEASAFEIYPLKRRKMGETPTSIKAHPKPELYDIRIKGHLDARWASQFDGLTIILEEDGHTLLTGPVIDQAALHGLLKKIRDLGLPLVSVSPVEPGPTSTLGASQADQSDVKS
jgi:hypothetical protein